MQYACHVHRGIFFLCHRTAAAAGVSRQGISCQYSVLSCPFWGIDGVVEGVSRYTLPNLVVCVALTFGRVSVVSRGGLPGFPIKALPVVDHRTQRSGFHQAVVAARQVGAGTAPRPLGGMVREFHPQGIQIGVSSPLPSPLQPNIPPCRICP